jgi:DNA-binding response OmpR family regulator
MINSIRLQAMRPNLRWRKVRLVPWLIDSAGGSRRPECQRRFHDSAMQFPHTLSSMARKRLLVVEDYQQLRDLIATVLREVGGYAAETAAESNSAERLIAEHPFDLVVLDLGLPGGLRGLGIASLARQHLGCPILFITGRDLSEIDHADLVQPGDRLLRKPFKMDVLLAEVAALVKVDAPKAPKSPRRARAGSSRSKRKATRP